VVGVGTKRRGTRPEGKVKLHLEVGIPRRAYSTKCPIQTKKKKKTRQRGEKELVASQEKTPFCQTAALGNTKKMNPFYRPPAGNSQKRTKNGKDSRT